MTMRESVWDVWQIPAAVRTSINRLRTAYSSGNRPSHALSAVKKPASRSWIELTMDFVRSEKPSPPGSARLYAYVASTYADTYAETKDPLHPRAHADDVLGDGASLCRFRRSDLRLPNAPGRGIERHGLALTARGGLPTIRAFPPLRGTAPSGFHLTLHP